MKNKVKEEHLRKILEESTVKIVATDNGVIVAGNLIEVLGTFSELVAQLNRGVLTSMLNAAFKKGLDMATEDKTENIKKSNNDIDKLKKILKELNELMGEIDE